MSKVPILSKGNRESGEGGMLIVNVKAGHSTLDARLTIVFR
jgi:hypothetical protein